MLIIAALVFFILVVAFILQQRIVNRGLRLAFWWTRFLPGTASKRVTAVVETAAQSSLTATLAGVVTSTLSFSALTSVSSSPSYSLAVAESQVTVTAFAESMDVTESTSTVLISMESVERTIDTSSPGGPAGETLSPSPQHDEL